MSRPRGATGLAGRLFVAQLLVVGAGGLTLWLVALAVGPVIFHDHLHRAAVTVPAQTSRHVEEAFQSASAISISVAVLASLGAALGVSAYVTRRIAGPVVRLAAAARDVAAGHYAVRVPTPALGGEFASLTGSFNAMAARLETVEATRRRLLADLAHEIRTPVATLDAYLEGLEDGVVTVDADTVAVLRGQTARLTRLTEDITAVSRADEHQLDLNPHPVAASQLIGAAVSAAADRYQAKGVRLSADAADGLPPVRVDEDRIAQVLGNLLDNALRHTPAGDRVSVAAARAEGAIVITVADTGEGIAAEHLPHVFERFYRADAARDRAHGGSGIGLAIVRALVDAHGGTTSASSGGPGQGTTVTVTLPTP